jgi:hypothetical protein
MYHSISRALQDWLGQSVTMENVREELALSIRADNVRDFIYRVCEDHREFLPTGSVDWNLLHFHRKDDLAARQTRRLVREPGTSFQGTDVVLRHFLAFSKTMRNSRIGCVVVGTFGPGFTAIYPALTDPQNWYFLLYCSNNAHWTAATVSVCGIHRGVLSLVQLLEVLPSL